MKQENNRIAEQSRIDMIVQTAFGVPTVDEIESMTKGLSGSSVYKVTVQGKPYLLRLVNRPDSRDNPAQYVGAMQAAAEAGIAPTVYYLNVADRISITDFIVERPFPIAEARDLMPGLIKRVHALPKFSHQVNYVDAANRFIERFQTTSPLADRLPNDLFALYARIGAVYPRHDPQNIVSSHNDLKPDNIIFDGLRPWLVDWEAAFLNDRYVDLAAMANFVVRSDDDEVRFLNTYFGKEADEYQRARFFLMSQIVHLFCFTLCMPLTATAQETHENEIDALTFREFHDRLWTCDISLADAKARQQYAWVHMQQLLNNLHSKRFEDSLYIVSQAGGGS